jgi:hypothetical protein
VIFIFKTHSPEKYSNLKFTTRLGAITYNASNKWHYEFRYLNGCVQGSFTAKNDHAKLLYSSNIEEGTITLGKMWFLVRLFQTAQEYREKIHYFYHN